MLALRNSVHFASQSLTSSLGPKCRHAEIGDNATRDQSQIMEKITQRGVAIDPIDGTGCMACYAITWSKRGGLRFRDPGCLHISPLRVSLLLPCQVEVSSERRVRAAAFRNFIWSLRECTSAVSGPFKSSRLITL